MGDYVIIESRDPFDSNDVDDLYELAGGLAERGEVTVFLVQNGVLATRRAAAVSSRLATLAGKATVLADEFSLRERGIGEDELVEGVSPADIGTAVDLLAAGRTAFWH
ncbi:MAG: DsrE family protein [Actinobacteria bacterium]|nr:DsrE family protein [Actinomycetota bacterium]